MTKKSSDVVTTFTIDGTTMTAYKWSVLTGKSPATMLRRKSQGYSDKECVYYEPYKSKRDYLVLTRRDGVAKTVHEWSKLLNLRVATILGRLRRGLNHDDALKPVNPVQIRIEGKTYTLKQWARIQGLTVSAIRLRQKRGYSWVEAITGARHARRKNTNV